MCIRDSQRALRRARGGRVASRLGATRQPGGFMDALDREVLIALQQDGRQTNVHLAERLGLSASAMHERVRRFERDGLVPAELNAHSRDFIEGFEKGVLSLREARACYHVTGRFDYCLLYTSDA